MPEVKKQPTRKAEFYHLKTTRKKLIIAVIEKQRSPFP
jgi:hypothetical protein